MSARLSLHAKTLVFAALLPALHVLAFPAAAQWEDGKTSRYYGRFADWPFGAANTRDGIARYEEGLVNRVFGDRLEHSGINLNYATWSIGFGWCDLSTPLPLDRISADVDEDYVKEGATTWVRKAFSVLRHRNEVPVVNATSPVDPCGTGDSATYNVEVSSAAPGTWVSSTLRRFFVEGSTDWATSSTATGFSHVAYVSSATGALETLAFGSNPDSLLGVVHSDWNHSIPDRNWILLISEQNAQPDPAQNAVVVTMLTVPPGDVEALHHFEESGTQIITIDLILEQSGGHDVERTIAITSFLGVYPIAGPAASWASALGGPATMKTLAEQTNDFVSIHPVDIREGYQFDAGMTEVAIQDTVITRKLDDACVAAAYVPMPPMLSLAKTKNLAGYSLPSGMLASFYMTKYGVVLSAAPGTIASYTIPAAPPHDVHVIRREELTDAQVLADQMFEYSTAAHQVVRGAPFSSFNNRGEWYALGLASPRVRENYLARMGEMLVELLDPAQIALIPPTPRVGETNVQGLAEYTFPTGCQNSGLEATDTIIGGIWRDPTNDRPSPIDSDAVAGAILEALYEYTMWTGEADVAQTIDERLPGSLNLDDLFRPIESFHDWATMTGSHDPWGGTGSRMDMFGAQYSGYHAYAGLRKMLHGVDDSEAKRAKYLQAKSQLALMLRLTAIDVVGQYFKTLPPIDGEQILPGFGEVEPTGPLSGFGIFTVEGWGDWTISGERFHPLQFEVYERLLRSSSTSLYAPLLERFRDEQYSGFDQGMRIGTFGESKIYAFARHGGSVGSPSETNARIQWFTQLPEPADGGSIYPVHAYPIIKHTADSWYTGAFNHESPATLQEGQWQTLPHMVFAGVKEGMVSPITMGGWGLAGIDDVFVRSGGAGFEVVADFKSTPPPDDGGAMVYFQSDRFAELGRSGADLRWSTVAVPISSSGEHAILSGSEVSIPPITPVATPTARLDQGDFTGLGAGGHNLVTGWRTSRAGPGSVVVEPAEFAGGLDDALRISGAGTDTIRVSQTIDLSDDYKNRADTVAYRIRFRYRVLSPGTLLTLRATDQDMVTIDATEGADVPPSDSFVSYVNARLRYLGEPRNSCVSIPASTGVVTREVLPDTTYSVEEGISTELVTETVPDWRTFEAVGVVDSLPNNVSFARPVSLQVMFEVSPGASGADTLLSAVHDYRVSDCGEVGSVDHEVWIDDVTLEVTDDISMFGMRGFRLPREGRIFQNQTVMRPDGEPQLRPGTISFSLFPDERVQDDGLGTFYSGSGDIDPGRLLLELKYLDIEGDGVWKDVDGFGIALAYDYEGESYRNVVGRLADTYEVVLGSGNDLYTGRTRLRVNYYGRGPTGAGVLVGSVESPEFDVLGPVEAFSQLEPAVTGFSFQTSTGENLNPYSIVNLDYDGDLDEDVFVTIGTAEGAVSPEALLYRNDSTAESFQFVSVGGLAFTGGSPVAARGAVANVLPASFGPSLLVCTPGESLAESAKIYEFIGGNFSVVPGVLPSTTNVWDAAVSDIDRDSELDLYLVRAGAPGPDELHLTPESIEGRGLPDMLLRWNGSSFVEVTSTLDPGPLSESIAATWGDVDNDRLPDLFVAHLGASDTPTGGISALYHNRGTDGFFDVSTTSSTPADPRDIELDFPDARPPGEVSAPVLGHLDRVTTARFEDIDGDAYDELVVGRADPTGGTLNFLVLVNESGALERRMTRGPVWNGPIQSLDAVYLDGDQTIDFVGVPASSSATPSVALFIGTESSTGERGYASIVADDLGIGPGAAQCVATGNYDGAAGEDIILGRAEDQSGEPGYLFANPGYGDFVRVSLEAHGTGNNAHGIGARIRVDSASNSTDPYHVSRRVGARGANAGAGSLELAFPVSGAIADEVIVEWPDGYTQTFMNVPAGTRLVVQDDHTPSIIPTTVAATYMPDFVQTVYEFTWETQYSTTNHAVLLKSQSGNGSQCLTIPKGGLTLTPTSSGVSFSSQYDPETGNFRHTLGWTAPCGAPCSYRYQVKSWSGTRLEVSAEKILSAPVCAQIQG